MNLIATARTRSWILKENWCYLSFLKFIDNLWTYWLTVLKLYILKHRDN